MDVAAAQTVPHGLRPTYLTIVRYLARHGYAVDAREGRVITGQGPSCTLSAMLRPADTGTRVVLLARGSWTRHHFGAPLSHGAARLALRAALGEIAREIPAYRQDYFPRELG